MNLTVRPGLKLALTLLFILVVYFQTISHPFSRFDDPGILEVYGLNSTLSWFDTITPSSGFYYRPIVSLSYWLDYQLWGMSPSFMHLENILAHLANVFLVFLIASRLPLSLECKSLPFISALLFGLHPINSEPVNWIPGRTDVLAGLSIFLAVYCLIRAIQEQSTRFALLAFGVAFAGVLTKEAAVMFIPAAFLVIMYWPVVPQDVSQYRIWRTRFLVLPIVGSFCLISTLLIVVYVKGHGDNALSLIFDGFDGCSNVCIRSFEAFGFYVKKVFLPLPLNVAIVEVNSLYAIVGIISLCILLVTFRRSGISGIFFAAAVLFTLPALLIAITSFSWTPFGERYLYIPSAFAIIGCLDLSYRYMVRWNSIKWFIPIVSIIIVAAAIVTIQRGRLWGDNLALLEDVIAKSPDFGVARNEYAVLLKDAGRFTEAEKQFKIALQKNNKENVNRIIRLNLIWMKLRDKQPAEVRQILLSEIGNKATGDIELLKILNRYDEFKLGEMVSLEDRRKLVADIIKTNEILYQKTDEPHYLYRSGQLALSIGNLQAAAAFFRKSYEKASPKAYYRESARKLAEKLSFQ